MRAYRYLAGLAGFLTGLWAAGSARAADCVVPSHAEIQQLHDRWAGSLATMHPDKVMRNYAPDATLLGLDSPKLHSEFLSIRDHYVYFLQREPKIRIDSRVIRAGCDSASDVGTMALSARPSSKAPHETIPVRYSLSYERRDGKWLIVHHHLSVTEDVAGQATAGAAPAPKVPAVAGFIKRVPAPKARPASAAPGTPAAGDKGPATEQLIGGWTYTPGVWRNGMPTYLGD